MMLILREPSTTAPSPRSNKINGGGRGVPCPPRQKPSFRYVYIRCQRSPCTGRGSERSFPLGRSARRLPRPSPSLRRRLADAAPC